MAWLRNVIRHLKQATSLFACLHCLTHYSYYLFIIILHYLLSYSTTRATCTPGQPRGYTMHTWRSTSHILDWIHIPAIIWIGFTCFCCPSPFFEQLSNTNSKKLLVYTRQWYLSTNAPIIIWPLGFEHKRASHMLCHRRYWPDRTVIYVSIPKISVKTFRVNNFQPTILYCLIINIVKSK